MQTREGRSGPENASHEAMAPSHAKQYRSKQFWRGFLAVLDLTIRDGTSLEQGILTFPDPSCCDDKSQRLPHSH